MKRVKLTLWRGPAIQFAGQLDTDDLGGLELPGQVGHNIDGVGTTNANSAHAETTSVGGVRISADEETTGEGVVLEQDLVDDTRAGLPETDVVLGACGGEEVVDLLVDADGAIQILLTTDLGLDQVVAVDGGGVCHGGHTGGHELEDGHLCGGILAGDTVWPQLEVGAATGDVLAFWVVQMGVQDLLCVCEGSVQPAADNGKVLRHLLVVDEVALFPVVLLDLFTCKVDVSGSSETNTHDHGRAEAKLSFALRAGVGDEERTLRSRGESVTVAMHRRRPREPTAARLRATWPKT